MKTLIITLSIILLTTTAFFVGLNLRPEQPLGAGECPTVAQALDSICSCPDSYLEVGCVDDITYDGKVKVKGASEIEIEYTDGTKLKQKEVKIYMDSINELNNLTLEINGDLSTAIDQLMLDALEL